jgi:hypothetical protein
MSAVEKATEAASARASPLFATLFFELEQNFFMIA